MHAKQLRIDEFDYILPEDRIAIFPLAKRDQSKLLEFKCGEISTYSYSELPSLLPADAMLVFNNTKVVEARLFFYKPTGAKIELFCLEPDARYHDITSAMLMQENVVWKCLVGGAKKWKADEILVIQKPYKNIELTLEAKLSERQADCFLIEFSWNIPTLTFADILHHFGYIPLPPYIQRQAEKEDTISYQTVFATQDGSVAAPTAGLHFTPTLLDQLHEKNITTQHVTLHVGAGTFKPVKSELLGDHVMHAEYIEVDVQTIESMLLHGTSPIVAVGTTSFRTLESLYWMGVKILENSNALLHDLEIKQWDVYRLPQEVEKKEALQALLNWLCQHHISKLICKTQLLVTPLYKIRVAQAILTNFHQPKSTLLLLISAFVGEKWKEIYEYAMLNDYRFLSYGDGSLLWLE